MSADSGILFALAAMAGAAVHCLARPDSEYAELSIETRNRSMSKILTLSIACIGGRYLTEAYRFTLDVPADSTLDDLASFILGMVDFDGDHLSAFYVANGWRGKKTWFTADGEWDEDDDDMWDIRLCDIFPLGRNKKLYYVYDFCSSWCFEILKKGRETAALVGQEYPCIVSQQGTKPSEYGTDPDGVDGDRDDDEDEDDDESDDVT